MPFRSSLHFARVRRSFRSCNFSARRVENLIKGHGHKRSLNYTGRNDSPIETALLAGAFQLFVRLVRVLGIFDLLHLHPLVEQRARIV